MIAAASENTTNTEDGGEPATDYKAAYLAEKARADHLQAKLSLAKEAKRSFLATVSHEIRTPLNGILTVAQMLVTEGAHTLNEKQRRQMQTILKCSVQLLMCVNDILDYAKLKSRSLRITSAPFQLKTLLGDINDIFALQANEKGIVYEPATIAAAEEELLTRHCFIGDEKRIRQVLQNLYNNALRFTPSGGRIVLTVGGGAAGRLEFTMTDSGPGVQFEESELIFDPFRQSNTAVPRPPTANTTGLGLAIARGLVEQMRGRLWLDTTAHRSHDEPQGARFRFYIELDTTEAEEVLLRQHGQLLKDRRVLIVDDMLENRIHLAQLAAKWHMIPHLCSSGDEALLYLHTMQQRYDIAWLDVHMPGMSGVELAQEIRKHTSTASLPLISLSSVGNDFDQRSLFDVPLEKPVAEQILLCHTLSLLKRSSATDKKTTRQQQQQQPLRVLVADDDETSRQVLLDVLDMIPAERIEHIKVVNDGEHALRHLVQQRYHVAILDHLMPGMNGLECARQAQLKYSSSLSAPVIVMLTANVSDQLRDECKQIGVQHFLTKPLDIDAIHSIMQEIYERGGGTT